MNYLKEYNITNEQIRNIKKVIQERDLNIDVFLYDPEEITAILNLFTAIGVKNIYNLIITCPTMFSNTVKSIQRKIEKFGNHQELARLLNEDASNLHLLGLL